MITTIALNSVRTWLTVGTSITAIASGAVGTNRTDVSVADTGLNNNANLGTSGTFASVTGTNLIKRDRGATWSYSFATGTTATGAGYGEFGLNDGTNLINRCIFETDIKKEYVSYNFVTDCLFE